MASVIRKEPAMIAFREDCNVPSGSRGEPSDQRATFGTGEDAVTDQEHVAISVCSMFHLREAVNKFGPTHAIIMADPGTNVIVRRIPSLTLKFHDIRSLGDQLRQTLAQQGLTVPPSKDHVQAIIKFGRDLPSGARLLCCCTAGLSRSPAAALIVMALSLPGREGEAFCSLMAIRPRSAPNPIMVAIADDLIGAGGRLIGTLPATRNKT